MTEVYSIGIQPFYDSISECYTHIFVIDRPPDPPLSNLVRTVNPPRLSPFQTTSGACCAYRKCVLALLDPNDRRRLLRPGDEAILFTYLASNGYTVDTSLTKIMKTAPVHEGPRLLCMISK
jgi:hypothetical protein